jgi:apolipoprotein D and lipocalin family protein
MKPTLLLAALLAIACQSAPPLDVAPVDLTRFQGKWYEIAKLPRITESGCEGTTAFYRLTKPDTLDVTHECRTGSGTRNVTASAIVADRDVPAKLSLDVGGFWGDYWIIEVGASYEYAVIGHPSRDYLWILSRTPTLASTTLDGVLERARSQHFDVSRLDYTVQP